LKAEIESKSYEYQRLTDAYQFNLHSLIISLPCSEQLSPNLFEFRIVIILKDMSYLCMYVCMYKGGPKTGPSTVTLMIYICHIFSRQLYGIKVIFVLQNLGHGDFGSHCLLKIEPSTHNELCHCLMMTKSQF
jgi:hypothetical protein